MAKRKGPQSLSTRVLVHPYLYHRRDPFTSAIPLYPAPVLGRDHPQQGVAGSREHDHREINGAGYVVSCKPVKPLLSERQRSKPGAGHSTIPGPTSRQRTPMAVLKFQIISEINLLTSKHSIDRRQPETQTTVRVLAVPLSGQNVRCLELSLCLSLKLITSSRILHTESSPSQRMYMSPALLKSPRLAFHRPRSYPQLIALQLLIPSYND